MRIALYARVSTDIQEARGSIGSQLEALRARADGDQHEVVAEYLDDGYSGRAWTAQPWIGRVMGPRPGSSKRYSA